MPAKGIRAKRAAIYARISDARDGDTAGVDRQVEDCLQLCEQEGLDVVETFVDNNVSAYRPGGKRPAYDALVEAVRAGLVDVVVAWSSDRLYRRLVDLEALTAILKRADGVVTVRTVKSGDVDLSTADGVLKAGLLALVAKHESDKKGERIARAARQRAEQGRFGGGVRRLGYNATMTETVPEEADAIAWAYRAVADGMSVRAVQREWLRRGLKGTQGGSIAPGQVTQVLRRPFNAGLVSYKGELLPGTSQVPPIVDVDIWRVVNAILADPARRTAPMGRPIVTMLAGVLRCGVCDCAMYRQNRTTAGRGKAYFCTPYRHVARACEDLDDGVAGLVVEYLTRNADRLQRPTTSAKAKRGSAAADADALRRKLDDLALLLSAGDLDPRDFARATKEVRARLEALDAQVVASSTRPATGAIVRARDIKAAWQSANLETQRAIVKELIEKVVVDRIGPTNRSGGMRGVSVIWRDA